MIDVPKYHEQRILPYTPKQLYDIVAAVDRYHEFLPWCAGSRINWRKGNMFNSDLTIGYKIFRESFNTDVILEPHARITSIYKSGPFEHLSNFWAFAPAGKGGKQCAVEFAVDFRFRSGLLNAAIGLMFDEAARNMIAAFEKRAQAIYGAS